MKDPQFIVKDVSNYWAQMLSVLIKNKKNNIKKKNCSQNLTASMKQPQVPVYPVCGLYEM
jgi:hypothetical protein